MGETCADGGTCETPLGAIQRIAAKAYELSLIAEEAEAQGDSTNAELMKRLEARAYQAIAELSN